MELMKSKPKKFKKFYRNIPLPTIKEKYKAAVKVRGIFNGCWVYINRNEDMEKIIDMGYFGKGNYSRSCPQFNEEITEIIRARQYDKRMEWTKKNSVKSYRLNKIIIVDDSDEDYENYFKNLMPAYELDRSGIYEVLCLTLEEAFFLANCVGALDVFPVMQKKLTMEQMWTLFSETDPYFISNYAVYNYLRAKNWIVKTGIKFGGEFLLYKEGPAFYHAQYVVIIDVFDKHHKRIDELSRRSMDNLSLLCLSRLCQTAGKELMVCKVTMPQQVVFDNLNNIIIQESLVNRCTEAQD